MNKSTLLLIFSICGLFFNASNCSVINSNSRSVLPQKWGKNMSVLYYSGGGMIDKSERFTICSDSAVYTIRHNGMVNKFDIKFTSVELDNLAKLFYENNFDLIRIEKTDLVYDKASEEISICVEKKCFNKGDGATQQIHSDDFERYRNVLNYLLKIVQSKINLNTTKFEVVIDDELLKTGVDIHYQIEPGDFFKSTSENKTNNEFYNLMPGKYKIIAYTIEKLTAGGTRFGEESIVEFTTPETKSLLIQLNDSKLIITKK